MRIFRILFLLVFVVQITACDTIRTVRIPKDNVPSSSEAPAYLAGTLAIKLEGDDALTNGVYTLKFRPIGGKESGALTYIQGDFSRSPKTVYETPDIKGGTFVAALRPGDYEFHNIEFFYNSPLARHTLWARDDFSIPFTLKPGRVLYVGELLATGVWGKNALQAVPIGGVFVRSDRTVRDKTLLEAAHPEIKGLPIDIMPMDKKAPPFVIVK